MWWKDEEAPWHNWYEKMTAACHYVVGWSVARCAAAAASSSSAAAAPPPYFLGSFFFSFSNDYYM